ncbi:PREDICTED: LOB domain-containing protein 19 [Camelina sativa]|uniref:LOB domain-containing protein 19 n=1 Tax=Camelina sativa TaxID=90675 RepID=A0ABM0YVI5_CAMSA|nr:PREDICTED: LOB domain-containing protein 19 [Camelina sativa]
MMTGNLNGGGRGGEGPCGACKFLRRKCVKGCVFAPYFDAEQGTARFAAVHKVFGASNASKMLLRLPLHKRFDAVVTLCYEAMARLRDPVYGSVGHLFSLQHQVMNLQAELAHVQARLSTFQHFPLQSPQLPPIDLAHNNEYPMEQPSNLDSAWEEEHLLQGGIEDGEFQELAMQYISRYLPAVKLPAGT